MKTNPTEEDIAEATRLVLPIGYKPEDYLGVNGTSDIPLQIAKWIAREAIHIRWNKILNLIASFVFMTKLFFHL